LSGHFGIDLDSELVSISRVILTDNRPIAYLIDILPKALVSEGDLQTGFTGSVLDRLIASNTYVLSKSKTLINAVGATSSIAKALEIQRGDVLLMFEAFLYDDEDTVIDYSLSYFLPGHFRFQVMRRIG
jgi:GntR family transcriptional regulator